MVNALACRRPVHLAAPRQKPLLLALTLPRHQHHTSCAVCAGAWRPGARLRHRAVGSGDWPFCKSLAHKEPLIFSILRDV